VVSSMPPCRSIAFIRLGGAAKCPLPWKDRRTDTLAAAAHCGGLNEATRSMVAMVAMVIYVHRSFGNFCSTSGMLRSAEPCVRFLCPTKIPGAQQKSPGQGAARTAVTVYLRNAPSPGRAARSAFLPGKQFKIKLKRHDASRVICG
jgi:hypothetical protein